MLDTAKELYRRAAPDWLLSLTYSLFKIAHPNRRNEWILSRKRGFSRHRLGEQTVYSHSPSRFPEPRENERLKKYSAPGFVELTPGDTIIDVGSFIGEFTVPASNLADQIVAVEPDPLNSYYLRKNTSGLDNVTVVNKAAWNTEEQLQLKRPDEHGKPSDASLMSPSGSAHTKEEYTVDATRLDTLAEDLGLDKVDFLKMDGEGVEPEILQGCENVTIEKVAVAASAERDGDDTIKTVTDILEEQGYETRVSADLTEYRHKNPYIVFGRLIEE